MKALTERQAEVLALIISMYEESGFPPTHREVAARLGHKAAEYSREQILALQRKGYLDIAFNASRAIKVLRNPDGIPVVLKFVPTPVCFGCGDLLGDDDVKHSEITDKPFCAWCIEEARKAGSVEFVEGAADK